MQILPASSEQKLALLKSNPYFSTLSPNLLEKLASGTSLRRYEAGEVICWQDESCAGLFIMQKGSAKLFKLSGKGRELIIRVVEEGTTFNEVPVFDQGTNVVNVAALDECRIWIIEQAVIRQLLKDIPEVSEAVILNLTQNLRMLVSMIEELSFYQVTSRLARLISQLSPEQLEGLPAQRLTQDQLAARLGTVREVVARSLRDLERSGAIRMERRQIQIVNRNLLHDWAQGPIT